MLMKPIKQPSSKQPNKFQAFANKLGPLVYNGLIKRGYTKRSTYDNVMSQLAFESTYGTSPLALRAHNYGGYGYNGKDYNVYKNDAAFIDAYLNDMAGKYKKALNADTVADYAKELKRIGYFEAPLDQYTKNLIGMQSVRKAAAVHYGQPIVQQKPALMAVQLPKSFVPQETAQTMEESAQNAFKQPVLPPVGRGPEPEIEAPQEQSSPFIFQHSIDLPPIEQTMGALLNDQPIVNAPGFKNGKDNNIVIGSDGNKYNIDWNTLQSNNGQYYANVSSNKKSGRSNVTGAYKDYVKTYKTEPNQLYSLPEQYVTPNFAGTKEQYYKATSHKNAKDYYDPALTVDFINAATLGLPNRFSVSQNIGAVKDLFSNKSVGDKINSIALGNSGVVSDDFYNKHPQLSSAINIATDAISPYAIKKTPGVIDFIDRRGVPIKNIAKSEPNTLLRVIGVGDSGYKDALLNDVIRGNMNRTLGSAKTLNRVSKSAMLKGLGEDDIRALNSSYIKDKQQFDRIKSIVDEPSVNPTQKTKPVIKLLKKAPILDDSYEQYLKSQEDYKKLAQDESYKELLGMIDSNKDMQPWIDRAVQNSVDGVPKGDAVPTFAIGGSNENVLEQPRHTVGFVGDHAIVIKNADKNMHVMENTRHFSSHPTTKRPMSPLDEDVQIYAKQDGLLTGKRRFVKIPKSKIIKDQESYKEGVTPKLMIKNTIGILPESILGFKPNIITIPNEGYNHNGKDRNLYKTPGYKGGKDSDYYSYMDKLAQRMANEWNVSEDQALTQMLNDNTYNYRAFYDNNRKMAIKSLSDPSGTHFNDIGKTMYHPTFSNESIYSGRISDYNPLGLVGGQWIGDNKYIPSTDQLNRYFNYNKTRSYMNNNGDRKVKIIMPKHTK